MSERKKLLITGAAGKIGTALRKHLRNRYDFRLMFHSQIPDDVDEKDEVVVSDISNFEAMVEAAAGVDAIAHLALFRTWQGMPNAQRAQVTFDVDMKGTYNIYEAARINRVSTVVYASTNHVTGINEKEGIRSVPDKPVRPDGIYGLARRLERLWDGFTPISTGSGCSVCGLQISMGWMNLGGIMSRGSPAGLALGISLR